LSSSVRKISIGIIFTLSYLGISQGTIKSVDRYNMALSSFADLAEYPIRQMFANLIEPEIQITPVMRCDSETVRKHVFHSSFGIITGFQEENFRFI